MLRSLLIGLDGSPYGEAAVELGVRWAGQAGARLVGIAVVDRPGIAENAARAKILADEEFQGEMQNARSQAARFLAAFAARCAEASIASMELETIGEPATQIASHAQRHDLLLLGQKTYFHFQTQKSEDSTLTSVIKHSPCPVVVVPVVPGALPPGNAAVVAYDGSLQAARALRSFLASGLWELHGVHVVSVNKEKRLASKWAEVAGDFLSLHEVGSTRHCIESGAAPGEVLLATAAELEAGLLVMGAYGRRTLQTFFFGSASQTVLKQTTIPVLFEH